MAGKTPPPPDDKKKSHNGHLARAQANKDDEYYTREEDVAVIADAFAHHLTGKRVYCNCDTEESAFIRYLGEHKDELGIAHLDRSFISYDDPENLAKLDACDVVITNPPFSIYPEFIQTIIDHGKDFILIAPKASLGNSWNLDLFMRGLLYYTNIGVKKFQRPDGSILSVGCFVITSFADMDLFSPAPVCSPKEDLAGMRYDDYEAIECPTLAQLPSMPTGEVIGVPITILVSPLRRNYEILGLSRKASINGKNLFKRVFVRRKPQEDF